MIKKRIFSDIDNTIVFSHRYDIGEKVLVEELNGKEQAYMTRRGYGLLQKIDRNVFVPITSRTIDQYKRLRLYTDGRCPQYALVDNGGLLLIDGRVDELWKNETKEIIQSDMPVLIRFEEYIKNVAEVKWQDEMVLFVKPRASFEELESLTNKFKLMMFHHHDKIYICSSTLTKGAALGRFKDRFPVERTIVAGDSEVDLSMIPYADEVFLPSGFSGCMDHDEKIHFVDEFKIAETIFGR